METNAGPTSGGSAQELEARLLACERELAEARRRQAATAEVLKVISASPSDVASIFDVIVKASLRLFDCELAAVMLSDGAAYSIEAKAISAGGLSAPWRLRVPIDPSANFPSRAIVGKQTLHLPDWSTIALPEHEANIRRVSGTSSSLYLPFLRDGECIGLLTLCAKRANAFGVGDIALAESFRDQALIAVENTRLFNETQEALQQQTATADVLKVISRSAFDLQAVFDELISSAVRLIGAVNGTICLRDGDVFRYRAFSEASSEMVRWLEAHPARPGRGTIVGRVILSAQVENVPDVLADAEYRTPVNALAQARSMLAAPLFRDGKVEGVLVIARREAGAFSQRHVDLLQTFADQAAIAIENVRLFDEVQARTRELTSSLDDLRRAQDRLVQSE